MKNVFLISFILLLLPLYNLEGQTLEVYGQKINFGSTLKQQENTFWIDGGQIESEYSYIEIFEGENITGGFYKNKLVSIYLIANDNNEYPIRKEIENLIEGIKPYKENTNSDVVNAFAEVFKTDTYYINKSSSRMNTEYTIIPIIIMEEIRKLHPEYYKNIF